jgi:hypothetical protein
MAAGLRAPLENGVSGNCLSGRHHCPDKKQKGKIELVSVAVNSGDLRRASTEETSISD